LTWSLRTSLDSPPFIWQRGRETKSEFKTLTCTSFLCLTSI
jgi:hypothetical protein